MNTKIYISYNSTIYGWNKVEVHGNNTIIGKAVIHCTDGDYTVGDTK